MDTKPIWQSKTVWGAIVALLATFVPSWIAGKSPDEMTQQFVTWATVLGEIAAFVVTIWGRLAARTKLTVAPGPAAPLLLAIALMPLMGGCASMFTFTEGAASNDLLLDARAYRLAAESVVNARNLRQITADDVKVIVPILRTWSDSYHRRSALLKQILDLPAASPQRETLIWQWQSGATHLAAIQASLARQLAAATAATADPDANLNDLLQGPTSAPAPPATRPASVLSSRTPRAGREEIEFD